MRKINKIVVHHSWVYQEDMSKVISSFNQNHKNRLHPNPNWYGLHIAYHYIIGVNWEIDKTRQIKEVGYHASNRGVNQESIGICLVWNFDLYQPTQDQYKALKELIEELKSGFGYNITIHGHNEFCNKSCPWKNFDFQKLNLKPLNWPNYKLLEKLCSYFWHKIDNIRIRQYLHTIAEIIRWNV